MKKTKTFSDSLRIERLLCALDGDGKRVVSAIGRNGLFYATALKALKREFRNPYSVSFLKLKAVSDQSRRTNRQSKRSQTVSSTTKNSHYIVNINGVFFFY